MTIQRYILRQLTLTTALILLGLTVVILPSVALHAFGMMGSAGIGTILEYLPLVLVDLVPIVLPMSFLLALVATYGRMAAEHELTAMRIAGVHPVRLMFPALLLAGVGALGTDHLLANVAPRWRNAERSIRTRLDELNFEGLVPSRSEFDFGSGSLVARERQGNRFIDVLALLPDEQGSHSLMADSAAVSILDGNLHIEFERAHYLGEDAQLFDEHPTWSIPLSELFTEFVGEPVRAKYFRTEELRSALAEGRAPPGRHESWAFDLHHRRAIPLVYFLFILIGMPLGMAVSGGSHLKAYVWAASLALAYFAMEMQLGYSLVRAGAIAPWAAAWLTTCVFLTIGTALTARALSR